MKSLPLFSSLHEDSHINLSGLFATLLLCLLVISSTPLQAQGSSLFTTIDVSGAGTGALQGTAATAIDAAGDVAGIYIDSSKYQHAFVRSAGGTVSTFVASGSTGYNILTVPIGFDTAGDLVGLFHDTNGVNHGFVRSATSGKITLFNVTASGSLPAAGTANDQGTIPITINGAGEIAGIYIDSRNITHGFVRSASGTITPFNAAAITGSSSKSNQGIYFVTLNASGLVAGAYLDANSVAHGFIRSSSASAGITTIDAPGAGTGASQGTAISGIDAAGDVTGVYVDANNVIHGFVRYASTGDFATIDAPGAGTATYQGTYPDAFDAAGDIFGSYTDGNNGVHGFVLPAKGTIKTYDVPGANSAQQSTKNTETRLNRELNRIGKSLGVSAKRSNSPLFKLKNAFAQVGVVRDDGSGLLNGNGANPSGTAGFGNFILNGVNASGETIGLYTDGDNVGHSYLRLANGKITAYDATNAGTAAEQGTGGLSINASGVIAGTYADDTSVLHGFIFKSAALTATTTALQSASSTSTYGGPITLTATVSPEPPNGEVVWFMSGKTLIGSQSLSDGSAQLTSTDTPVGSYSVTAVYPGDLSLSGSTSSAVSQKISKATTKTALKSSQNPSTFGQAVTFTATVSGQLGGTATGSVIFSFGKESATVSLSSGVATLTTSVLPEGSDSITAAYGGDTNFTGSKSGTLSQAVQGSTAAASFVYTIAGNGISGYSGDGGLAISADINQPFKAIPDSAGNVYIADSENNRIRKVAAGTGIITTIAGTGIGGWSGDNGPATSAQLYYPTGLVFDGAGNLLVADEGNGSIRKINLKSGIITTVAGVGPGKYGGGGYGDGGPATSAWLSSPHGIALDAAGNLYIADDGGQRIRKVAASTGYISTVAGTGSWCQYQTTCGDGGLAINATFQNPEGIAVDGHGNIYIADLTANVIRKVTASSGIITTVAGNRTEGYSGDGGQATSAKLSMPYDVALDSANNLYIADSFNGAIRKVTASNGVINTVAGGVPFCSTGIQDGYPAPTAEICLPFGISFDSAGNLYVADDSSRIRLVTAPGPAPTAKTAAPIISLPAGTYATPQTVTITDATHGASIYVTLGSNSFTNPAFISYNAPINVTGSVTINATAVAPGYLPSSTVSSTYTITEPPSAVISTIAGSGVYGFSGAGGAANSAETGYLSDLAFDGSGNLYFADENNYVVWSVSAKTGDISIVAGNGKEGTPQNYIPATSTSLSYVQWIAVDHAGNLYIADPNNRVVRKVAAGKGILTTYAGNGKTPPCCSPGIGGNGGLATSAQLGSPEGLAVDKAGNLYIADESAREVLKVTASTGIITVVAGNGNYGYTGDNGLATSAELEYPTALALDSAGDLFIADNTVRVRKVKASTGIITTVAGNGDYGYSGDGGLATSAEIGPWGIALDSANNLYIANGLGVRVVSAKTGIISTVAGGHFSGYGGDGGSATVARIEADGGIALDAAGDLYIADTYNYRIREVTFPVYTTAKPTFSPAAGSYTAAQSVTISDTTPNATIYYTTNGDTPTTSSTVYKGAISVTSSETIKAVATAPGERNSAVATAVYTLLTKTTTTLAPAPTPSPSIYGEAVTLSATVSASSGSVPNGENVTFLSGTTSLGTGKLSGGKASLTTKALPAGTDSITAVYGGDAKFAASTSNKVSQVVKAGAALSSPKQGATFTGSSQTFTWAAVTGATGYRLYLGSTGVGSNNLLSSSQSIATTLTAKNLPVNGETIYARLLTNFNGVWAYNDYTFTAFTKK